MSRIQKTMQTLKSQDRKALIPYITAGDPSPEATVGMMHALVSAGADIIELGVPFSDPMADGPVIQAACERALANNTSLRDVLAMVKDFRAQDSDTAVVLMGYLNPIERMGSESFIQSAVEAGVDGVLIVDLTPEESYDIQPALVQAGLDPVYLIAPTSGDERTAKIAALAAGYLYYVSFKGVTGANRLDVDAVAASVEQIRRHTDLPVAVGFGVRDADTAAAVARVSDAVVVGSALVQCIADCKGNRELAESRVGKLLAEMRAAMDTVG